MTDSLLKRFVFVRDLNGMNGMSGKQLIPISSPQIQIGTAPIRHIQSYITIDGKYHGTACFICTWRFIEVAEALRTVTLVRGTSQHKQILGSKSYGQGYDIAM